MTACLIIRTICYENSCISDLKKYDRLNDDNMSDYSFPSEEIVCNSEPRKAKLNFLIFSQNI